MSHKNQESLHEFEYLIGQLSRTDNQPISQRMSPPAKRALRQKLLEEYESQTLSRQNIRQLWRFAGSVAGIVLIAVAVIGFGIAISQAQITGSTDIPTANSTIREVETAVSTPTTPTSTPPLPNLPPDLPLELGNNISLIGFSFPPGSNQQDRSLPIELSWEVAAQSTANYTAFVHLIDENGLLVAQADKPLGEYSILTESKNINAILTLPLSDNLPPGIYTITTGLYDNLTGQQLPQDNGQGIPLTLWEILALRQLATLPVDFGDNIHLIDFFLSPQPYQPGQPLEVNLSWEASDQPTANYTAFVHLLDETGSLVAQVDQSLGNSSTFVNGVLTTINVTLMLPDDLPEGMYSLTTGLYDGRTGQSLPQNDDGQGLYLMRIEITEDSMDTHQAIINGTDNNGLALLDRPKGQQIATLDEGSVVQLADAPRVEEEGFIWQAVETIEGQSGWVAAEFLIYQTRYTLAEIVPYPFPSEDNIWVISAKQLSRASENDPITFEITLGVKLVSADEAILKLFYTNPAWHSGSEIELPIYMIGGDQIVYANTKVVTVTAVLDPTQMATNVKTNAPTLMTQLGTLDHEKPWLSSFKTSLLSFFDNVQFDLESLDKIEYTFDNQDTFEP